MAKALTALFFIVAVGLSAASALASDGSCDIDLDLGCDGGGSGGGGGGSGSTTTTTISASYHWGPWAPNATCGAANPRYVRYLLWADGTLVSPVELTGPPPVGSLLGDSYVYQQVCITVTATAASVWAELVEDIEALPESIPLTSPSAIGITGLETWFWYDGVTQVGPVGVSWTDGTTGVTFELQGVAWIGTITWNTGDGVTLRSDALAYSEAPEVGGSEEHPAVRHMYEQTSSANGFAYGYPVVTTITWVGEWRWRTAGGGWEPWRPMTNSLSRSTTRPYPVSQVIGQLEPIG